MSRHYHTIIIGSGAAGLSCALELVKRDIPPEKILIVTESLGGGTSLNAGSDKQTYYKLSINGSVEDSPLKMAHSLYDSGAMHGDIALIESTCSIQAFMNLVNLGVHFPHDEYGGYIGYKTDNDPFQRGTSIGPLTSKEMCKVLLREVKKEGISILDHSYVLKILKSQTNQACGIIYADLEQLKKKITNETQFRQIFCAIQSKFVVLATGGSSLMYKNSVYPISQYGSLMLAIEAGATLQNLTESQYGIASIKFRWNMSGSYQQVLPRYFSIPKETDPANPNVEKVEFLKDYFPNFQALAKAIFLKGYQWPFNVDRIDGFGSSLIDMAVHIETVEKNRRVFLDYRQNLQNFSLDAIPEEVKTYLQNSNALQILPIDRLARMNLQAIKHFQDHNINLYTEPLEIAVCAQHCNGGVTGDMWWQTTIPGLFAIGEVNGSHGIHRPGGSALNSGQVGAIRAAEKITYGEWSYDVSTLEFETLANEKIEEQIKISSNWKKEASNEQNLDPKLLLNRIQDRMMETGAYIRNLKSIQSVIRDAKEELKSFHLQVRMNFWNEIVDVWRILDALVTQMTFLLSYEQYILQGGSSRGSYLVITNNELNEKIRLHPLLQKYKISKKSHDLRKQILQISCTKFDLKDVQFKFEWIQCRPLPENSSWFESAWKKYENKEIWK